MAKVRIGNMVITSNNELNSIHSQGFTKYGYQQINSFLSEVSRDFRVVIQMLWKQFQTQPTKIYKSDFIKFIKDSKSFGRFVFAANIQQMAKTKIPFEFHIKLFKSCYQIYEIDRETGARGYVVGTFCYLGATYPEYKELFQKLTNSLDVTENINSGRTLYIDEYIALTYNRDIKNESLGELLFASRNSDGLWTFDKTDVFVPVKSLRKAKKALADYNGKPRKGELIGNDSIRFVKFLELEIRDNYAYMPNYQEPNKYRGKGFR